MTEVITGNIADEKTASMYEGTKQIEVDRIEGLIEIVALEKTKDLGEGVEETYVMTHVAKIMGVIVSPLEKIFENEGDLRKWIEANRFLITASMVLIMMKKLELQKQLDKLKETEDAKDTVRRE